MGTDETFTSYGFLGTLGTSHDSLDFRPHRDFVAMDMWGYPPDELSREVREKLADKLARAVGPENTKPARPLRKRFQKLPRCRLSPGSQD